MQPDELTNAMGLDGELPRPLAALLDYSEKHDGVSACDFEFTSDGTDLAEGFLRDEDLAKSFAVFGVDGMLSLYALWLDEAGVPVYLDADWDQTGVLAGSLEEFIALLALGRERLGMIDQWFETEEECEGIEEFRAWAKDRFGLTVPSEDEAQEIIRRARERHPDLKEWIEERRSTA